MSIVGEPSMVAGFHPPGPVSGNGVDVLSTVSHELRTPLTSIRGSLGLLAAGAMGELPPDADMLVKVAEENSIRLMNLVNDLLDLEKLRSGRTRLAFGRTTTASLVADSVRLMEGIAHDAGVRIIQTCDNRDVLVDVDRMVQVVQNLVHNAVRHSRPGQTVEVSCSVVGEGMELSVMDRGPGIPDGQRDSIFEPFQQSEGAARGGTGLGLSICREIVEGHGGEIRVESREGGGSRFLLVIPAGGREASGA